MVLTLLVNIFTAPLHFIYLIKWILSYVGIRINNAAFRSERFEPFDATASGNPVTLGYIVPQLEKDLESPFPETHLQDAADEVMFYGVNSKSEYFLVRISRGCNQEAEAWIHLKLANGKSYQLAENTGYQQSSDEKSFSFSCGKLQMYYLSPMRRWRIFFCGMLKESLNDNKVSEEDIFVKFTFLWKASSDVYDATLDTNPEGFARAMARSEWDRAGIPPIQKFREAVNFYAQSGVVTGTVSINEGPDYEIYLFGGRLRNMGKGSHIAGTKFTNILGNIPEIGLSFQVGKASAPYIFNNLPHGFVVQPNGQMKIVKELEITVEPFSTEKSGNFFKAELSAAQKYEVSGRIFGEPIILYSGQGWNGFVKLSLIEFTVGNKMGSGYILSGEVYDDPPRPPKLTSEDAIPNSIPLTVQFADEISHFGDISGGKGSSLGKLTYLSRNNNEFTVPEGIVVTTSAYSEFLTAEITDAIKQLENVAYGNIHGDVKHSCDITADIIRKTLLPQTICNAISQELKFLFGDEVNHSKFAVRSSATVISQVELFSGEDTSAMSAAGQMDTFLGVQGLNEAFKAVKKCWASQFSYIAVEYKRRNGQPLNCPMAVVIQKMVSCDVSGVLFTCDPVTHNPSVITITANYGLGETVVSGTVEPDTIFLRRIGNEGDVELESVKVGSKHQRIVMQDSGGTVTEEVPENSRNDNCLSREKAERLGKIAIMIEDFYKSPRDIEWGLLNDDIYILQSRPVTNAAAATDYEIMHEFDSPLRCEQDYLSTANTAEVMPGASSPLGMELTVKLFGLVYKKQALEMGLMDIVCQSKYFATGIQVFYNHLMLTVIELITRYGLDTPKSKGFMISVFGRILDDEELMTVARGRVQGPVSSTPLLMTYRIYRDLFTYSFGFNRIKNIVDNYQMSFMQYETARETFDALLLSCSDFDEVGTKHIVCSEQSSNWNMYIFTFLSNAKGGFDTDVYSDIVTLLATSSDVESADVPQTMQNLANQIVRDINCEDFRNMTVEEAEQWLKSSRWQAGDKFRDFLKRHGHRCLRELDIQSTTWEMDTKPLIKILQNLAGTCSITKKEEPDISKIISELHVPLTFWSRFMLKFILTNCHRGVRTREMTKSLIVKSVDFWRRGYHRLAQQMVSEGRIPDMDLLYFFTLDEINDLLETRSPAIISRATHRKRLQPILDGYKFPEIMKGLPKPINETEESADAYEFIADLTMKGVPVSQGITKGFARVAISLEEASYLKPGEILITYSTDIGWSPYFPIISVVVTEMGGLISHGAVVSREYGLPCVVGLRGATKKFHTGDFVLLDGKKGILQRLPQPEYERNP